jgi:hypothetical protein
MKCPTCNRAIEPNTAWKGDSGRFYCSEFCADAPGRGPVTEADFHNHSIKERIDRQYLERLERLVPYARRLSNLIA